jgi:hypothetical protein
VAQFVTDLDAQQVARAVSVAAPKTAFPLGLVLLVGAFLAVQNRIDRNDPKLALAPVHGDRHVDFGPHPATRLHHLFSEPTEHRPTDPGVDR